MSDGQAARDRDAAELAALREVAEAARAHRDCHYEQTGYRKTRERLWAALDALSRAKP